jgi:hypothetical protein
MKDFSYVSDCYLNPSYQSLQLCHEKNNIFFYEAEDFANLTLDDNS